MKQLNLYITEKLKINKDSRNINNSDDFFKYLQEIGCIVIRPFTNKNIIIVYLSNGKEEASDSWSNDTWTYPYFKLVSNVKFFEPYTIEWNKIVFRTGDNDGRVLYDITIFDKYNDGARTDTYEYSVKNADAIKKILEKENTKK